MYHESAHHLILSESYFVGVTIADICEAKSINRPRQLGHSYLFYFTGQVTKSLLEQEGVVYPDIYMVRNKVFSRYYPLLDQYLRSYMDRKITLGQATEKIIEGLK